MATSTVDRTIPWCPSTQPTPSNHSSTLSASIVSKSDARNIRHPSSINLTSLRENPTRISRQDSLDAVVDTFDNGDDDRNTHKTTTSPTTLAGNVDPLPYQSELAAITAAIERMKKNDAANYMQPEPLPPHPTSDNPSALAAISAAIAQLETKWPTVQPPVQPSLPTIDPMPDADAGNPPNEARHQLSSLQATFNLQTQMMRTIKKLLVELDTKVDLLIAAATRTKNSPILSKLPTSLPLPPTTLTICRKPVLQPHDHYPQPQFSPWPPHPAEFCNKLAPVSKISPYKKYIPAKPPFSRGRHGSQPTIRTKDRMRPP